MRLVLLCGGRVGVIARRSSWRSLLPAWTPWTESSGGSWTSFCIFHRIPKASRDQDWLSGRRDVLSRLHALWRGQDLQLATLRLDLARAVRTVLDKGQPGSSQAVVLADFTNEALERLRAKAEATNARRQERAEKLRERGIVEVDIDTSDDEQMEEVLSKSSAVHQLEATDMQLLLVIVYCKSHVLRCKGTVSGNKRRHASFL